MSPTSIVYLGSGKLDIKLNFGVSVIIPTLAIFSSPLLSAGINGRIRVAAQFMARMRLLYQLTPSLMPQTDWFHRRRV